MSVLHIVLAVLGIGLLIFLHECGHFFAARWSGVRVDAFSLGFGPVLWSRQKGPTEYRLSLIPLGGYVKLAGELPSQDNTGSPDELCSKNVGTRAFIFSAGVLMNLLTALVLFPVVFYFGVSFVEPVVGEVAPGGLAWRAGIEPGSRILEVDGSEVYGFEHILSGVALGSREGVRVLAQAPDGSRREHLIVARGPGEPMDALGVSPISSRDLAIVVEEKGPAAKAGLMNGDRILTLNGAKLEFPKLDSLEKALVDSSPIRLEVARGSQVLDFTIVPEPASSSLKQIGIRPLTRRIVADRRTAEQAARIPLREGDILLSIDETALTEKAQIEKLLDTGKEHRFVWLHQGERKEARFFFTDSDRKVFLHDLAIAQDLESNEIAPLANSPAQRAGIRAGDRVLQVGTSLTQNFRQIAESVRAAQGPETSIVVQRGTGESSEILTLVLTPAPYLRFGFDVPQQLYTYKTENLLQAGVVGLQCSVKMAEDVYLTIKRMLTRELSAKHLGGILQIGNTAIKISEVGFTKLLFFLALLSINLAILNILPIPILDGGHLLFLLIEKIKGSPVSERVIGYSQVFGLVVLLTLMVFATYNDIQKLFFP